MMDQVNFLESKKLQKFFYNKPYNYYVSVLLKYLPDKYAMLKKKYLVANCKGLKERDGH